MTDGYQTHTLPMVLPSWENGQVEKLGYLSIRCLGYIGTVLLLLAT